MITVFNHIIVLTFITLSASSHFSLTTSDPCVKFDRCHSKSTSKTCNCDSNCHMYRTCCHDVKNSLQDVSDSPFQCYYHQGVNPVFVKRSCSEDFRGHVADKMTCLEDDVDPMDVKNNVLVTSRKTKTTYWNKHCAVCNNEAAGDLEFWNIEVSCPHYEGVDRSLIRRNLTFDQDKSQWGLVIGDEFLECIVKYSPSPYIEEVNHCTPDIISSCPVHYNNEDVATKCSQYYAERKLRNKDIYFRNIHCAMCNGVDVKELECKGMYKSEDNVDETDFVDMVEEVFSSGNWLHREPGKNFECSTGFIYDPLREKCRRYEVKEEIIMIPNSSNVCTRGSLVLLLILVMFLFKNNLKWDFV